MKAIEPSEQHRHTNRVVGVAFAPDGAVLGCGYDAFVLWDNKRERWRYDQSAEDAPALWHAAYSPDGTSLIAGGFRKRLVELDPTTGAVVRTLPARDNVFCIAFAGDGSRFTTGERPELEIWKPRAKAPVAICAAGKATKVYTPFVSSVAFSRDGARLVATCGKTVSVFDTGDGALTYSAQAGRFGVSSAVFANDGTIVSVGASSIIEVRDPTKKSKKPIRTITPKSKPSKLAIDPTGTRLLGAGNGQLELWDLATGDLIVSLEGPRQAVDEIAISRDGARAAACGLDSIVFVWDLPK